MARPTQPKDPHQLYQISRMYYEQEMNEGEIASRLRLSHPKVSRLLKEARRTGIVRITLVPPVGTFPNLETRLESRYHLQRAIVVDIADPHFSDAVSQGLGIVAASHLEQVVRDGDIIGITWGKTLSALVAAMRPRHLPNCRVVQIIGGLGLPTAEVHATDLCRRMAHALDCQLDLLPAPGIMESRQSKKAILSDKHVQKTIQLFSKINLAVVGIGAPTPDSVVMRDGSIMSRTEMKSLTAKGAVGDIALRYFDDRGCSISSELDERVIGITLEQLKGINRVIGVAGGPDKLPTIRGALLGKFVNTLVTDQVTAKELLK